MLHCLVKKENGVPVLSAVVLHGLITTKTLLFWFDNTVTVNAHYQKVHNVLDEQLKFQHVLLALVLIT